MYVLHCVSDLNDLILIKINQSILTILDTSYVQINIVKLAVYVRVVYYVRMYVPALYD